MNYHNITKDDMLNGDGLRVVLWVSGCSHYCKECQNPRTWDVAGGIPFDITAREEIFAELDKDYMSGITYSGGDPLHPANREEIGDLIQEMHERYPGKTQWLYSGFLWEELKAWRNIQLLDVVVDGHFLLDENDNQLFWRGSANQRVIDVRRSLELGQVVLHTE